MKKPPIGSNSPVDIDLIDRIEVIRGPGSALYGTNAFLAVINVITKNGKDLKGGEFYASGGVTISHLLTTYV
jgi:outer membrane receptor for ferrienterochelin and colicins